MEAAPPTYEKATLTDYWDIIARYVPSNDLCSAALVCSRWHGTFAPHLWGNPASHFGIENDRVYVALTKFKRTLKTARLLVRSMTHTLHIPPAHAEIYNGPQADWLRDVLERLPNLQTLIVRGLPFFDHAALQALRSAAPKAGPESTPEGVVELPASSGYTFLSASPTIPAFGLRLLDASRCTNITASGLSYSLSRFEALMYLDLSFTYPARDPSVLGSLRRLSGLQVLKLRGLYLSDELIEVLAKAIGRRVRSLDIRDNAISDRGVRTLLEYCFTNVGTASNGARSPALLPYLGSDILEIYQGEDFEAYLRDAFTRSFVSRLAIEDVPEGGITHLYIAGNHLSVEAASALIHSGRMHVLDLASVARRPARHPSPSNQEELTSCMDMPGVEKLTPMLSNYASETLSFLRIDHDIVTKDAPKENAEEVVHGRVELADTALLPLPANAIELDSTSFRPEVFELPTVTTPRAELAGDPMQFMVSPAVNDPPHVITEENEPVSALRRGSAFAPEAVDLDTESDRMTLLSPVSALGEGTMSGTMMSAFTNITPPSPTTTPPASPLAGGRPRTYSSVDSERKARLAAHTAGSHNLHPAMLPHLTTLVLTALPPYSHSKEIADRLICFIKHCAEEALFAKTQANLDYAFPPGRKGYASALKHSEEKIFALKRLVIEIATEDELRRNSKASQWQHSITKSMTEDRDSEALWSAAETDFSFFGEGEECDFPSLERGRFANTFGSNEKEVSFASGHTHSSEKAPQEPPIMPKHDTIALLSAFRKERRLAHQRNIAAGVACPETEGYWDGVVQVVRPGSGLRADEEVDYYGNRFLSSGIYR